MGSDVVISAEGLGKKYRIGHNRRAARYTALRDVVAQTARNFARSAGDLLAGRQIVSGDEVEEFWALQDVNFEIKRGEVVGIIGRNGAGKSTLLKILSRITEPTAGRVTLKGRVASLLEVGTGFHPELTGRENIYLNGAILGMTRAEIRAKFDQIVAFAEVEKFLDTPVKRYSSGMYVRLAFAVAAHLEPEILIVDEVLAVGDAEFQKKCLGKMQDVAGGGRTVLFVSHNMAAVQNLCKTGHMLAAGKVIASGAIDDVVGHYHSESLRLADVSLADRRDREGTGQLRFSAISFRNQHGLPVKALTSGAPAKIELALTRAGEQPLRAVRFAIGVDNEAGLRILVWSTHLAEQDIAELPADADTVSVVVPKLALAAGRYELTLFCTVNNEIADWVKTAGSIDVETGDFYGSGQMPLSGQGCFLMEHRFEVHRSANAPAVVS